MSLKEEYVKALTAGFRRQEELAGHLKNVRYFADIQTHSNPYSWRVWRDCRLYLDSTVQPIKTETYPPLGIVWLHNPSKAFSPRDADVGWQEIEMSKIGNPEANAINYVASLVVDAVAGVKGNESARCKDARYCNIEELVYLESDGVRKLWQNMSNRTILEQSHARVVPRAGQAFQEVRPGFIWLAWGGLYNLPTRQRLFNCLANHAADKALKSGVDTVFAARLEEGKAAKFVAVHRSSRSGVWTIRHGPGRRCEFDGGRNWDFVKHPPLHPQELRNLDGRKWNLRDNLEDAMRACSGIGT